MHCLCQRRVSAAQRCRNEQGEKCFFHQEAHGDVIKGKGLSTTEAESQDVDQVQQGNKHSRTQK